MEKRRGKINFPPTTDAVATAEKAHADILKKLNELGVMPEKIPNTMKSADEALKTIKELVEKRSKAKPGTTEAIDVHIKKLVTPENEEGAGDVENKFVLAEEYKKVYPEGVRGILEEILAEGTDEQKMRATQLLAEHTDIDLGEPAIRALPEDAPPGVLHDEETRAGWKKKMAAIIYKIPGVKEAKEKFDWYKSSEKHLVRRSAELDAQAKEMGKYEKAFRSLGEKYNKLDWKGKLAVGLALGVGGGLTMTAGSAWALAFVAGSVAQRAAGLATMYMKFEAAGDSKEKAMFKAIGYTAAMGAAMATLMYEVKEVSKIESYERVKDALGKMLGHTQLVEARVDSAPTPAAEAPAAAAAAGEAPRAAAARPEVPQSVHAPAAPASYQETPAVQTMPDGSHHGVPEELRKQLDDTFAARENAAPHITDPDADLLETEGAAHIPETQPEQAPLPQVPETPAPEPSAPEAASVQPEEPPLSPEAQAIPIPEAPAPAPEASVPTPEAGVAAPESITNQFGLKIPTAEPHIYGGSDAAHTFAYGGTPVERANAIEQFLRMNPNKVVFSSDDSGKFRLAWHLENGNAVVSQTPMRTSGFLGLFSTWMKPPGPEDLEKLIK